MAIFYRAINDFDIRELNNNRRMLCNVFSEFNCKQREYKEAYRRSFMNSLSVIYGHINGHKIDKKTSCWISAAKDFKTCLSEYAVPQNGLYNLFSARRYVAVLNYDNAKVKSGVVESYVKVNGKVDKVSNRGAWQYQLPNEAIVDLEDTNFINSNVIIPESYNDNMPGYNIKRDLKNELSNTYPKCNGLNGFSKVASEVLIYASIPSSNVVAILSPLYQDIFYNVKDFDFNTLNNLSDKINGCIREVVSDLTTDEQAFFDYVYGKNWYIAKNHIDYNTHAKNLSDIALEIDDQNIVLNYEFLKRYKRIFLKRVLDKLVADGVIKDYDKNMALVDDRVYVAQYDYHNRGILIGPGEYLSKNSKKKSDIVIYRDEFGTIHRSSDKIIKDKIFTRKMKKSN